MHPAPHLPGMLAPTASVCSYTLICVCAKDSSFLFYTRSHVLFCDFPFALRDPSMLKPTNLPNSFKLPCPLCDDDEAFAATVPC